MNSKVQARPDNQSIDPMRQLDLFSALQSSTEGIDTELKSARGGMLGSSWESYSAMANTQGGTIVLGMAEKPTGLVWEGVPDAAHRGRRTSSVCGGAYIPAISRRSKGKPQCNIASKC